VSQPGATSDLPVKTLGRTGLEVTTIGLGCGSLGRQADDMVDEEVALATVLAALDAGVRLIDTASLYLNGRAERIVGEALRQRPGLADQVVVETKVRDARDFGYSGDEARRSVETSLTRLGLDRVSMIYIHDPPAARLDRVMGAGGALAALRSLQAEGVVGHVGIASNNPWDNAPFVETGEFEAAVVPDSYSLLSRVALERIFPAAERFGMGVVVATPLERGLLATGVRAARWGQHSNRRFSPESIAQVERLEQVCARHGVSLLAAALQYVTRHPVVAAAIPGPRSPEEARANARAAGEPIPETLWAELTPLIRSWDIVAR
jgi:D-threo-aldose 1-dehydrogenase